MNEVDEDGSGEIDFDEFLLVIKNSGAGNKMSKINKFFKDLTNGNLFKDEKAKKYVGKHGKNLSFGRIVSSIKRGYMMDAIMSPKNSAAQKKG